MSSTAANSIDNNNPLLNYGNGIDSYQETNSGFKKNRLTHPLAMYTCTIAFHSICTLTGLPLNLRLAIGIALNKELYTKPRNIILLSRVLCNIFTLFMAVDEIIYYYWPNESVCHFFISFYQLPYILFFLNLLLSLIDRYAAMAYPIWHHQTVTARFTLSWLLVLNAALALAVNWIYISGAAPLLCEIQLSHAITLDTTLFFLCISCIVFRVVHYMQTKSHLPSHDRNGNSRRTSRTSVPVRITAGEGIINHDEQIEMNNSASRRVSALSVHMPSDVMRKLEKEATRTMIFGILRILLLPCTFLAFTFTHLICLQISPAGYKVCSNVFWLIPYFNEIITFHTVVHPSVFFWRNRDFFSTAPTHTNHAAGSINTKSAA